jgi:DNA-binding transcriptional MerR regulator
VSKFRKLYSVESQLDEAVRNFINDYVTEGASLRDMRQILRNTVDDSILGFFMEQPHLREQIVGYEPPSQSPDDPGYEAIGDTSVPAGSGDEDTARQQQSQLSSEDEEDLKAQIAQLQQQRSGALKKGDSTTADHVGVQMQRLQDVLG